MKKFKVQQEPGYVLDKNRNALPEVEGIYVVYECDVESFNGTVCLNKVLYVGSAKNIRERHNGTQEFSRNHDHYKDFVREAGGAEHVCYGVIPFKNNCDNDLKWLEYSLIHALQPDVNSDGKDYYKYPAAEVEVWGVPSCWRMRHFSHPFDNGDEIDKKDLLQDLL